MAKPSDRLKDFEKYNLKWAPGVDPLDIEMEMVKHGGAWKKKDGTLAGKGLKFHFQEMMKLLWPWLMWHPWAELQLDCYLKYRIIGQIGCASSGKSFVPAACVMADYYCNPHSTTVLVSSTTRESLEMRVWGEIKKLHKSAKRDYPWLPGYLIEGRQRLVTDPKNEAEEGRDFRNGLLGVACKRGQAFQGIEEYCFPEGTMVDTPDGPRPIEKVKAGDIIYNACGVDRVTATSSRIANDLVAVILSDGRRIECTPNHPFLTRMGWMNAVDIPIGSVLISQDEAMQILWQDVHSERPSWDFLQSVLLGEVDSPTAEYCISTTTEYAHGHAVENKSRHTEQATRDYTEEKTNEVTPAKTVEAEETSCSKTLRRIWNESRYSSGGVSVAVGIPGSTVSLPCINRDVVKERLAAAILVGLGLGRYKVGCRSGWTLPSNQNTVEEGCIPGRVSNEARVAHIEILQSVSHGGHVHGEVGYRVHNLHVENHPSYSVQGLLVHNCGIKNKHLRMIADELQFMPKQFVDSISNMNKNKDFKCVGSGNPKDTTDALGVLCEPAAHLGGWDGGIDQTPKTKTWEIRFPQGICIQFPGSDSPNLDGRLGIPLITQEAIDADIKFYGKDSIQYTMMDEGRMPRGQGNRRVITRQFCLKHGAMESVSWLNNTRTRIGCLDAAYRGVGGDRCVFHELQFGENTERRQVLALVDTIVVPIRDTILDPAEDQLALAVKDHCQRKGISPEHLAFDSTGRGSLMSAFARLWSPNVVPVEFGGSASERPVANGLDVKCKDYYSKFVTELWWSVRLVIESGQFRGMTEEVMAEGCAREWTMVGSNKIEVEPKDKTKLKTGRSPDMFDALATGVEMARRLGFKIERLTSDLSMARHQAWKDDLRRRARDLWAAGSLSYK